MSAALRDDKEVVMAAVGRTGVALRWASPGMRRDQEVVLAAVAQNCFAMEHAAPQLQGRNFLCLRAPLFLFKWRVV